MKKIIKKYANQYGIPTGLIRAIIKVESSGNNFAMRYENHYKWLVKPLNKFHWHKETEEKAQKTSWGLMQIMGAVARERGFEGRYLSELTKPELGIKFGCKHLKWNYNRYDDWSDAISAFNQGSNRKDSQGEYQNQSYVNKVLKNWK